MKDFQKLSSIAIPALLCLGAGYLGLRIISNEKNIQARRIELELQLAAKALKRLS